MEGNRAFQLHLAGMVRQSLRMHVNLNLRMSRANVSIGNGVLCFSNVFESHLTHSI